MKNLALKLVDPIFIIFTAAILRVLPHEPNFAPISAIALFSGVYLSKRITWLLPFLILLFSDYLLLYINPFSTNLIHFDQFYSPLMLFHQTTFYVYLSFGITILIGQYLRKHLKPKYIVLATVSSAVQFFIITNFGVWTTGYYPKTIEGLISCYIAAIPFFKGTLMGDLFYTSVLFGGYGILLTLLHKRFAFLPPIKNKSNTF